MDCTRLGTGLNSTWSVQQHAVNNQSHSSAVAVLFITIIVGTIIIVMDFGVKYMKLYECPKHHKIS
jgi:hypothetical protein